MNITNKLESLLFIATKPLLLKKIAELCQASESDTTAALAELEKTLNEDDHGIHLLNIGNKYQLVTNPNNSKLVAEYVKSELTGELTRPALETLTIIAYRGPIVKSELDIIRGVNCSLILRNLMIKGLIEGEEIKEQQIMVYNVTFDFLRYLGVNSTKELPDYDKLSSSDVLTKLLNQEINPKEETTQEANQSAKSDD
ncbi:MAG: SMC-Scp complex subunit ScpB [Patescibacteria group bacterium]